MAARKSSTRSSAVNLATGFRPAIHEYLVGASTVVDEQGIPRATGYQTGLPGLYLCGFAVAPTDMLREIGIEAKKIAQAISRPSILGKVPVPGRL